MGLISKLIQKIQSFIVLFIQPLLPWFVLLGELGAEVYKLKITHLSKILVLWVDMADVLTNSGLQILQVESNISIYLE